MICRRWRGEQGPSPGEGAGQALPGVVCSLTLTELSCALVRALGTAHARQAGPRPPAERAGGEGRGGDRNSLHCAHRLRTAHPR